VSLFVLTAKRQTLSPPIALLVGERGQHSVIISQAAVHQVDWYHFVFAGLRLQHLWTLSRDLLLPQASSLKLLKQKPLHVAAAATRVQSILRCIKHR
jgi:hypothetical protein